MTRYRWHCLFAAIAIALGLAIIWQLVAMNKLQSMRQQVASFTTDSPDADALERAAATRQHPAIDLAVASGFVTNEQYQSAESLLVSLIREHEGQDIGVAATYNLANSYLRQAAMGQAAGARTAPLIELAKQRYREALRQRPNDWHIRFNLEQALRLLPETDSDTVEDRNEPVKRVNVIVPDFTLKDLP